MEIRMQSELACSVEANGSSRRKDNRLCTRLSSATIKKAVIIAAGKGSRLNGFQNHRPKPLLELGGLSLIERVILSAKRNGIREFAIVIGYQGDRVKKALEQKDLGVKITWVYNDEWERPNGISALKAENAVGEENFLLFMSDHVFDYRILNKLETLRLPEDGAVLFVDRQLDRVHDLEDATKVLDQENRIINLGKELTEYNAIDTGIFACTPALFDALRESQAMGDDSLSGGIRVLARRGDMETVDIGDYFWQDVDTVSDVRHAEKLLFKATRSEKDGKIARSINRPISNFLSKWLVKTSLTPNQLSFLNFLFGLVAAGLVSFGRPLSTLLGGIVFQLTSIFDGCDGEVALLKMNGSKKGAFFDTIMDYASYVTFIAGVSLGAYRATHNPLIPMLSIGGVSLILLAVQTAFRVLARKSGSMKDFAVAVERARRDRTQKWYVRAFSYLNDLGRRDLFSFLTMLILLSGNIVVYYWLMIAAVFLMGMGISTVALFGISQKPATKVRPKPAHFYLREEVPAAEKVH